MHQTYCFIFNGKLKFYLFVYINNQISIVLKIFSFSGLWITPSTKKFITFIVIVVLFNNFKTIYGQCISYVYYFPFFQYKSQKLKADNTSATLNVSKCNVRTASW